MTGQVEAGVRAAARAKGPVLFYGPEVSSTGLLEALAAAGIGEPALDWSSQGARLDRTELRRQIAELLGPGTLMVKLAEDVPAEISELLADLADGQVEVALGEVRQVDPAFRLVALCPKAALPHGVAHLFSLRISVTGLLQAR